MPDPPITLPPDAHLAALTLRVAALEPMVGFYGELLGLEPVEQGEDRARLAPAGSSFELELLEAPDAPARPRPSVGLYHWALLLPERRDLAAVVHRLRDRETRFQGFSDHGVSEAVYLADPEGNGVELYRDRPQEAWPTDGDEVAMRTDPLNVDDLLGEAAQPAALPAGTRLGHVHLHAASLDEAGRFYRSLGLRVRQSSYPGALFLAAGEYHHHVGLNEWAGDTRAPEGARGLVSYTWDIPEDGFDRWRESAGTETGLERDGDAWAVVDPAGVQVRFRSSSA